MQSSTSLAQQRRGHVGADKHQRRIGLKTLQQRRHGEQDSVAGGGKDRSRLSTAAVEAVSGKHCGLFMPYNPVAKAGRLPQGVIESDVVDAGNTKAATDATAQ